MSIDLMPWLILWAFITTGVLTLALWRLVVVRREENLGGLHVAGTDVEPELEVRIARTLARIDLWGKMLTAISVVLVLAIGAVSLYQGLLRANTVIR